MAKIIMHIDLNAFFVSCEILKNPSLKGKPIAVGGTIRRGVISTSSYEARKLGVFSAMPVYMALKKCPSLILLEGDYKYYSLKSKEFFSYIKNNVTSIIEMASIDEAFVDMTTVLKDVDNVYDYLKKLQDNLYKITGLGCSIGLSTTKFLAKMASDLKKPMGITIILKKDIPKILFPLPIGDMFGVGKKTKVRLEESGIKTIGDFYYCQDQKIIKSLGKMYNTLMMWLKGLGDDEVITEYHDPKSISTSTTFMYDTDSYDEIKEMLKHQVKEVISELNKRKMVSKTVTLTIKDSNFKSITRSRTVDYIIKSEEDLLLEGLSLLEKHWSGKEIRLIGIGVSNLINIDACYSQLNLFTIEKEQEECKTRLLINDLNRKMNKNALMTGKDLLKNKK